MGRPRLLAVFLVAALLLLAVAALQRRSTGSGRTPAGPSDVAPSPPQDPPASKNGDAPAVPPTHPGPKPPAPAPARLRVTLLAPGQEIGGYVSASAEGRRGEGFVEIGGRDRAEAVFKALPPGPKRIVFVPRSEHAPAVGDITLVSDQEGALELVPRPVRALEGVVVDALRRPLPGARVKATAEGAFAASASAGPVVPLMSTRRMGASGGAGVDSTPSFRSFSAYSDGRVELATDTDASGRFRLPGLPGPTVLVQVGEGPEALKRACAVGSEAYLIVPVVREPIPETRTREDLRDALSELADRLGRDPQADEAYWAQAREQLRKSIDDSRLSAADKAFLRPLVESLGRRK